MVLARRRQPRPCQRRVRRRRRPIPGGVGDRVFVVGDAAGEGRDGRQRAGVGDDDEVAEAEVGRLAEEEVEEQLLPRPEGAAAADVAVVFHELLRMVHDDDRLPRHRRPSTTAAASR